MRPFIFSVIAVAGLHCVPGNSPLRITGLFSVDSSCTPDDSVIIESGRYDASGAGKYYVTLRVASEVQSREIQDQNGVTLTTPLSATFTAQEVALSYSSRNPTVPFESERLPIFGTTTPGSDSDLWTIPILGPKAAQKLRDNVTDPMADPHMTLFVSISIRGHLDSGESIATNAVTYPIDVFTTAVNCPNLTFAPTGACGAGGGQDGAAVICCTGPGTPVGCP